MNSHILFNDLHFDKFSPDFMFINIVLVFAFICISLTFAYTEMMSTTIYTRESAIVKYAHNRCMPV